MSLKAEDIYKAANIFYPVNTAVTSCSSPLRRFRSCLNNDCFISRLLLVITTLYLNPSWPFWYRFTFLTCSGVSFSSLATCSIIDSMKNTAWVEAKRTNTISIKKNPCYCNTAFFQLNAPGDCLKLHQFLI